MAQPVKNLGSGAEFNQVPFISNALMDIPGFKGCCGGFMKFSYVISAPLHMKGFWEFWATDKATWADRVAVTVDLLAHLALWIVALVLEVWCNAQSHKGHPLLAELMGASLWGLIVAFIGIGIAQIFAMTGGGQEAGKLFPTTYAAIVGGAYTSIVFGMLWAITQVAVFPEMNAQYDHGGNHDDALKHQRQCMLWAIALKIIAVVTLVKNANFWGPCTTDSGKEAKEQQQLHMKAMGVTSSGAMTAQIGV
jgi:hypothetical protein